MDANPSRWNPLYVPPTGVRTSICKMMDANPSRLNPLYVPPTGVRTSICKMMDANPSRWNLTDVSRLNWKLIRTPGFSLPPLRGGPGKLVNRKMIEREPRTPPAVTPLVGWGPGLAVGLKRRWMLIHRYEMKSDQLTLIEI